MSTPTITDYHCPLCDTPLVSFPGHRLNPNLGVTLECPNYGCPAQEVAGYGRDEAAAFKIITDKYKPS